MIQESLRPIICCKKPMKLIIATESYCSPLVIFLQCSKCGKITYAKIRDPGSKQNETN